MKHALFSVVAGIIGLNATAVLSSDQQDYLEILNSSPCTATEKCLKAAEELGQRLYDRFEEQGWGGSESPGFEKFIQTYYPEYRYSSMDAHMMKHVSTHVLYEQKVRHELRALTDTFVEKHLDFIRQTAEVVTRNWSAAHKAEFNAQGLYTLVQTSLFKVTFNNLVWKHPN